jgi:hypothetical protein
MSDYLPKEEADQIDGLHIANQRGGHKHLHLNSTDAATTYSGFRNATAPASTAVTTGLDAGICTGRSQDRPVCLDRTFIASPNAAQMACRPGAGWQILDFCKEWLTPWEIDNLRAASRPKPPSLKELRRWTAPESFAAIWRKRVATSLSEKNTYIIRLRTGATSPTPLAKHTNDYNYQRPS